MAAALSLNGQTLRGWKDNVFRLADLRVVAEPVTDMVSAPVPGRRLRPGGGAFSVDTVVETVADMVSAGARSSVTSGRWCTLGGHGGRNGGGHGVHRCPVVGYVWEVVHSRWTQWWKW
jgi:hypothetical protein